MKKYKVHLKGAIAMEANTFIEAEMKVATAIKDAGLVFAGKGPVGQARLVPTAPKHWKVGMKVEYVDSAEWAWSRGTRGVVVELGDLCATRFGSDYQVFWVRPLNEHDKLDQHGPVWWTTPSDVRYIPEEGKP